MLQLSVFGALGFDKNQLTKRWFMRKARGKAGIFARHLSLFGFPLSFMGLAHFYDVIVVLQAKPQAVNCYPEPTKFNVEVNLEGGLRSQGVVTADNTTIGREYVDIVARMPLYSSREMNREREREYLRRTKTSELIGAFLTAIATRKCPTRDSPLQGFRKPLADACPEGNSWYG